MPLPRGRSASRRRWATGVPRSPLAAGLAPAGSVAMTTHDGSRAGLNTN